MSEQTTTTPPTKDEIILFFREQIEVKQAQLDLQEINTNLAVLKAEELKALGFIAQMTEPQTKPETKQNEK